MSDESTKTYLLDFKGGKQKRITVPADWKVTFGPIAPGSKGAYNGREGMCLRLYESKEKQRAVFTDVVAFRDADIAIQEKVVHRRNERAQRQTPDGMKDFLVEAQYAEWRDEDQEGQPGFPDHMRLPQIEDEDDEDIPH